MKKRTMAVALFHDALYQVLDNKVFRILMVLTVVLVAVPWLVGFREDELVLAWGWKRYFYEDILASMGWLLFQQVGTDQERMIGGVQSFLVSGIAGTFGMFFSLAATSFFVPRLLEKGAADPLFSKPVSRFALLLSRYVAGLLFILVLGVFLVGGIHLGFLVNSQYGDVTLLWTLPILVYTFGLLFSFTVMVGTWTRSATAALLLSFVFLGFTGGVHLAWKGIRMAEAQDVFEQIREAGDALSDPELEDVREDLDGFTRFVLGTISTLHHALPKTGDADALAQLLRKQLEEPQYTRELAFRARRAELSVGLRPDGVLEVISSSEPMFVNPGDDGSYEFRFRGRQVRIELPEGAEPIVTTDGEPAELLDPDELADFAFGHPDVWFSNRFSWTAEWRYNAWYSLGSSLAFVLVMLGLSWVRLRRINF